MSIEVPENMEEVAMKVARARVRGEAQTEEAVIKDAVKEILQGLMDEALDGHYDDVTWQGAALVVTDFMGKEEGRITPEGTSFVVDFKADADALVDRFVAAVTQIVGGR